MNGVIKIVAERLLAIDRQALLDSHQYLVDETKAIIALVRQCDKLNEEVPTLTVNVAISGDREPPWEGEVPRKADIASPAHELEAIIRAVVREEVSNAQRGE